jgi:hypothetical protein
VTRGILLAASIAWLTVGVAAVAFAVLGASALMAALPPLAIDLDALRGALVAIGGAMLGMAGLHVAIVVGLARPGPTRHRAATAAMLLGGVLVALFVGLAAAAWTSAAARPELLGLLLAAGAVGGLAAGAYALVVLRLVADRRAGGGS